MQRCYGLSGLSAFLVIAVLFFGVAGGGIAQATEDAQVVDRIVAVVNEDIITLTDLNQAAQPYVERISAAGATLEKKQMLVAKLRQDLLNQLIDEKLSQQEIKRAGITVSDKEIDMSIARIKAANFADDDQMMASLAARGVTLEEYRQETRKKNPEIQAAQPGGKIQDRHYRRRHPGVL